MSKRLWIVNLVSLIIILIFGTLLAERYYLNIDLTETRMYTLSEATKKMLKSLKDSITVKVFFSKDIPYPYNTTARYVMDILRDYRRLSGGKVLIDRVDPDETTFERDASRYGIPPVQVNAIENDQIQIKKVYMGLAFVHADRIESIPVITDTSTLEYEVSSTIKTLLSEEKKTVGFTTGHGEKPLVRMKEFLKRQYNVKSINLKEEEPEGVDLLIIAGPTNKFEDNELYRIDQFIMKGGKVLFLVDRVQADLQYGFGRSIETGIEDLLQHYGIKIEPALVYDLSSGVVNISERRGGFIFTTLTRYPFFPKIVNLNREEIITRDIETITLGYTSPIEYTENKDLKFIVLARTSDHSGILRQPFYVAVNRRFRPEDFSGPPSSVALIAAGKFTTKFGDKKEKNIVKEGESRILVVADSEFATDEFIEAPGNAQFLLNCIDWLAEDDSLISIRSKKVESRPIRQIALSLQKTIKYATVLTPSVLTVIGGLIVWIVRKRRRRRIAL
jgi:gliding-associated putative ABC transporter substrate-binding component GldG